MADKVLFDVDTGCDDALMLLTALASDELDVVGITTVFGNASLAETTRNTLSMLEFADRSDVPVTPGADRPLASQVELDAPADLAAIHGEGGLTVERPPPETDPLDRNAAEVIVEQARTHGEELTLAAVGPQTNLAMALALEPRLPDIVGDIYVLAGAARRIGNVTPAAGFNCYLDPEAARRVFRDGGVRMVGMDVTERAPLSHEAIDRFGARGKPHGVMAELMAYYPDRALERYGYPGPVVHDTMVAVELIEDVLEYEEYYVDVETTGLCRGRTVCDVRNVWEHPPNTSVAMEVNETRYRERLFDELGDLADRLAA